MTPDIKPTIIPASRFLSDTIAAMLTANCYCQCTLPGGAIMRYRPGISWAVYRQGERPDPNSHTDRRFKAWQNELATFRTAINNAGGTLASAWGQLQPAQGWYGARISIMPSVESLFSLPEVQS